MKRLADQTLYEILEIPPGASAEQIEAAYEKARALYGPGSLVTYTLMEPDEAALLEARIEDARGTLLDPERRARYDAALEEGHGEARAVASGSAAPTSIGPPAVVPAAPPPAPPLAEPLLARPAILLGAALGAAGAAGDAPAPPPHPGPILLQHAIVEQTVSAAASGEEAVSATGPAAPPAPRAEPPPAPPAEPAPAAAPAEPVPTHAAAPAEPAPAAASTQPAPAAAPAQPAPSAPREAPPAAAPGPVVPPPIPDSWTGDALRQVREARGLTIQQIADRTKITRHHIENIEGDRFASLPAHVYLRGILLTIARELRLDGQKVARSYIDRLGGAAPAAAPKPR